MSGSITITQDDQTGLICVDGEGFWSEEQALFHFGELARMIDDQRAKSRPIRVMVDLRDCPPQSSGVAEVIRSRTAAIYRKEDRIAQLVRPGIQWMQMSRVTQALNTVLFDDPVAALRWLGSDEPNDR